MGLTTVQPVMCDYGVWSVISLICFIGKCKLMCCYVMFLMSVWQC